MKKLIALLFGTREVPAPPSWVSQDLVYAVSPASTDAELVAGTVEIGDRLQAFFAQDDQRRAYRGMTAEDWTELTQLTTLLTAAGAERARRDTFLH